MKRITESEIGEYAIGFLEKLGYKYIDGPDIAPARQFFEKVLLIDKLRKTVNGF